MIYTEEGQERDYGRGEGVNKITLTDFFASLSPLLCERKTEMVIRWRWKEETTEDVDDDRFIHPQFLKSVKVPPTLHPSLLSPKLPFPDQQNCHVGFSSLSEEVNSFRRGGGGMKAGSGRAMVHSKKRNKMARKLYGS